MLVIFFYSNYICEKLLFNVLVDVICGLILVTYMFGLPCDHADDQCIVSNGTDISIKKVLRFL